MEAWSSAWRGKPLQPQHVCPGSWSASPGIRTARPERPIADGLAHAARGHGDQLLDRGRSAAPVGPNATDIAARQVTDDFPEFVAVLDRELDAIETYLGA